MTEGVSFPSLKMVVNVSVARRGGGHTPGDEVKRIHRLRRLSLRLWDIHGVI